YNTNKLFYKSITNKNNFNFIDGFPISAYLSIINFKKVKRIQGPYFFEQILSDNYFKKKKHFLLGNLGEKEVSLISKKFNILIKNISYYNPPFIKDTIKFNKNEISKMSKKINASKCDYLWIGIGNPKQEILANDLFNIVKVKFIFNVGAGFDFISNKKKHAPKFIQKIGFEWFYRLVTDFKHSFKKVINSIKGFIFIFSLKLKDFK
ncbi:MAG: WecB/TagA/CpsF family glycosyltransferase, partial [Candidatus ainarchaeum sp.]|nr:WecB/TagA/CpsF family glycosyltransferase [Candidatus ainarchaeum sp.]